MGESPTLMGRFGGRAGAFVGVRARGATVSTPQCPAYAPCGSLDLVSGAVLLYSESSEVPRASFPALYIQFISKCKSIPQLFCDNFAP